MELALYGPGGYYERPRPIGKTGDYFTSVSVGPLFGELLAFRFSQWLDRHSPEPVELVEGGAHDGILARDILEYWQTRRPDLLARIHYSILEPSPIRRAGQKHHLASFGPRIRWASRWRELERPRGLRIIFSNEMLDALPVHRCGWDAGKQAWFEWGVTLREGRFTWARLPRVSPALGRFIASLDHHDKDQPSSTTRRFSGLPDQFTLDLAPAAEQWWSQAARALQFGYLMTLDYGRRAEDFFGPRFQNGTLRGYRAHHLEPDPLTAPGEIDLTADVNFSALHRSGEKAGLQTAVWTSQRRWLTGIATETWNAPQRFPDWTPERRRQLQTLIHPEHLGEKFKVLVQTRGVERGGGRRRLKSSQA